MAGTLNRSMKALVLPALVLGSAAALGLFGGVLSAAGRPELTAIFIGLVIAALIFTSRNAVFWFVLIGALVVTGAAQLYLPGSRYIRYIVPLASAALLLHWLSDYFHAHQSGSRERALPVPGPVKWAFGFAFVAFVSVLINLTDPQVAFVGTKNYFQMWAFFLGVAFLRWGDSFPRRLVWGLLLIGLVQLPFALHQQLYLVPQRIGLGNQIVPADVVAGTFGASMLGGGANAAMAAFQIVVVGLLLALWKYGALSLARTVGFSLLLLTPLLFSQTKITVLYVPLMYLVIFHRDIVAKPGKFLLAGVGVAAVVAILMTALTVVTPSSRYKTWSELVDFVVSSQTASVSERREQGNYSELSRWTALTFWAREHVKANPAQTIAGHGLGASRESEGGLDLAHTLAEQKYPGLRIGLTAISSLLWDTGILGLIMVLGMFASAFLMAGDLVHHYHGRDRFRTGLFEGLRGGLAVLALSLAHKDFFVVHLPYQTFVYLLVGFIAYSWLQIQRERDRREPANV